MGLAHLDELSVTYCFVRACSVRAGVYLYCVIGESDRHADVPKLFSPFVLNCRHGKKIIELYKQQK